MRLLFLTLSTVVFYHGFSQSCLPGGITFTSQAQVNAFPTNYPGCTEILGDININGSNISNLNPLVQITKVNGELRIHNCPSLTSLSGLNNISTAGTLSVQQMTNLPNLQGLNSLTVVNQNILIVNNPAMISLDGLNNLIEVTSGSFYLHVLENLQSIVAISNLEYVGSFVRIAQCYALTNLDGFNLSIINEGLQIYNNNVLADITALNVLTSCDFLSLGNNPLLSSLDGLQNLTTINSINIYNCDAIQSMDHIGFTTITGSLSLRDNEVLSDLTGLANINMEDASNLNIYNNPNLSVCGVLPICQYLNNPTNPANIANNAPGCATRAEVETACIEVLPVHFLSFDVKQFEQGNKLLWRVSQLFNSTGFEVQHSSTATGQWEDLSFIKLVGNQTDIQEYSHIDYAPKKGYNDYRIKEIGSDGSSSYSVIRQVANKQADQVMIYPNPAPAGVVTIEAVEGRRFSIISLSDVTGHVLVHAGSPTVKTSLDLSNFPAGIYCLTVGTEGGNTTIHKLVVY